MQTIFNCILAFLSAAVCGILSLRIVRKFLVEKFPALLAQWLPQMKARETWVDILSVISKSFFWIFFFFIFLHLWTLLLQLPKGFQEFIQTATVLIVFAQIVFMFWVVIGYFLTRVRECISFNTPYDFLSQNPQIDFLILRTVQVFGIVVLFLMALSNLGVNVTALITGVGIGGIAIALAAQNILGDVFASFIIAFDKPFRIGDSLQFGPYVGTVEQVGIKSTRIRSVNGELIVVSNSSILNEKIQNFTVTDKRRIVVQFGLVYGSDFSEVMRLLEAIDQLIRSREDLVMDRLFFENFGPSSLDFELVFWVKSNKFLELKRARHDILCFLNKEVGDRNLSFAFPTRTVIFTPPDEIKKNNFSSGSFAT